MLFFDLCKKEDHALSYAELWGSKIGHVLYLEPGSCEGRKFAICNLRFLGLRIIVYPTFTNLKMLALTNLDVQKRKEKHCIYKKK